MQTITTTPVKRGKNRTTANRPKRVMHTYWNWVNKRKENSEVSSAYKQPLDPDAFNDEMIKALGI